MSGTKARPVLLVGSVPLESSKAVFEAVGTKLGKVIKRIPDGETGARKDWVVWQGDVFKNARGLEPGSTRDLQGGYRFILYKVKPGETVKFGSLGYAAAAIRSYEDFKRARSEGKVPTGTRFQVSLQADWRLFPTLVRFDVAYFSIFKCNQKRVADYPNLSNYMRELYQMPGVADTVKPRYYVINYYSIAKLNPTEIIPKGTPIDLGQPHDRARLAA